MPVSVSTNPPINLFGPIYLHTCANPLEQRAFFSAFRFIQAASSWRHSIWLAWIHACLAVSHIKAACQLGGQF